VNAFLLRDVDKYEENKLRNNRTNISITNQRRISHQNFKTGEHFSLQSEGMCFHQLVLMNESGILMQSVFVCLHLSFMEFIGR